MIFFMISVVGGLTPGASAPGKPPPGHLQPGYAVGEDTRTGTGPRRHEDHPPPRSQPGTTPAAQAGRAEDRPRTRQHAQQADPPRLDSGQTTTDHRHPGTASAATIDSRTATQRRHSAHSATTADTTPQRPTPSRQRPTLDSSPTAATQHPPTVTTCTAHSPPPYTRPGSAHGPPQPRHRSTPTQPQPTPRTAPGRPPAPPLDHWTGSGQ